mgnify:CR=1 FL=1
MGRYFGGLILFLFVAYAAWWIAWYAGAQSGNSSLPMPPYGNVIAADPGIHG